MRLPALFKLGVHRLVFAEFHDTMEAAILREKRLRSGGARGNSN